MTLRTILTVVITGAGAIAAGVALALILLTSSWYRTGLQLAGATERVRLLMELESYALQHVREDTGADSRAALGILERIRSSYEPRVGDEIPRLEAGLRSVNRAATREARRAAFESWVGDLRRVVAREDADARRALQDAAARNRVAQIAGFSAVAVLLVGVAGALAWLWRRALQPLVAVVEAITRFARGDTTARAAAEGPPEIRRIAVAFNDMAVSLGRQREQQLAFIGGVAHDLRTPLNALQIAVTILDEKRSDPVRVRDRIRRQIARLERMVGDLLDRTRIETGRFELRPEPCDLRDLVARTVEIQRDSTPARRVSLTLPHEPVPVRCDPVRIEQVVGNLIGNAVKYSPDSSDVDIVLRRDDGSAEVSVSDHGIGVTAADRETMFEPFTRGKNVGHIGGTGLGLSVARKIVHAHGGSIDVHSEPGSGSVFVVRLPLESGAALAADDSLHSASNRSR